VDVNVVLPGKNNLPFMTWATMHVLPELLESGVKVHLLPPPFVHTKLFVVDDYYVQLGSCNLDPRSLNLNFELVVEVYDEALAKAMATHVDENIARAEQLDIVRLRRRPLWRRLRNAFFWLFSPYL
jgi:cardiolipin synthase